MYIDNKTIIITDPCYITPNSSDWYECKFGENMESLGFTNYITSNTIYGDWSCTTYEQETGKVLGEFCADAGTVGVFELDEVLKYNPEFDYHINRPWTTTVIPNFTGEVNIVREDVVSVVGTGSINFYTKQTGA